MKRTLTLKKESLSTLTEDELGDVAGGQAATLKTCIALTEWSRCGLSDFAMSLCGCLTSYCSIDVC